MAAFATEGNAHATKYCISCGHQLPEIARFCSSCGFAQEAAIASEEGAHAPPAYNPAASHVHDHDHAYEPEHVVIPVVNANPSVPVAPKDPSIRIVNGAVIKVKDKTANPYHEYSDIEFQEPSAPKEPSVRIVNGAVIKVKDSTANTSQAATVFQQPSAAPQPKAKQPEPTYKFVNGARIKVKATHNDVQQQSHHEGNQQAVAQQQPLPAGVRHCQYQNCRTVTTQQCHDCKKWTCSAHIRTMEGYVRGTYVTVCPECGESRCGQYLCCGLVAVVIVVVIFVIVAV